MRIIEPIFDLGESPVPEIGIMKRRNLERRDKRIAHITGCTYLLVLISLAESEVEAWNSVRWI